jgi:uncharacterized protein YecT (DUF1311 family)
MRLSIAICGTLAILLSAAHSLHSEGWAIRSRTQTAEQQERQRKWRDYVTKRHELQAHAKQIFDAEMGREKVNACTDATTTYDINVCFGKELKATDDNLKSYQDGIRELIGFVPETPGTPASVPASSSLSPAQSAAEFDHVNQAWEQYRDAACAAAFHQFDGGTGGPSFEMQCRVMVDRDHMRELSVVYGGDLRL